MVSKSKALKSLDAVIGYIKYLGNPHHRNHLSKIVCAPRVHNLPPGMTLWEFVGKIDGYLKATNSTSKRGRKASRLAFDNIGRPPFFSDLNSAERHLIENDVVDALVGPTTVAVTIWHLDRYEGTDDFHAFTLAFDHFGRLVVDRDHLPRLRAVLDRAHNKINEIRKKELRPRIETVPDVRQRKNREKNFRLLANELADCGNPPANPRELRKALMELGYVLTRFNVRRDYLSVKEKEKKPIRHCISDLLLRLSLIHQEKLVFQRVNSSKKKNFVRDSNEIDQADPNKDNSEI